MEALEAYRRQARAARAGLAEIEEALEQRRNLLRLRQDQLARALRDGKSGTPAARALQEAVRALEAAIAAGTQAARERRRPSFRPLGEPAVQAEPWELVEGLDDRLPFLLLPVRVETRFMTGAGGRELWVRIFPDEVAVHTHEPHLTADEIESGKVYWREHWRAGQADDPQAREERRKGAWRALAEAYGGPRAAWVARETRPANLDAPRLEDLQFPRFPEGAVKPESWSQAPRSKVMPDRFVVMGFSGGQEVFRAAGSPIPDPLILGPDPRAPEPEFLQEGGRLLAGEAIAWIYDFSKAVELGMGVRVPLEPEIAEKGLAQLVVLGLRLSADARETQALVEELFENHLFAPDGLGLVPQGTPTNNTEQQGSGFSSQDLGAEASYELERAGPLIQPVDAPLEKSDGQRLVEALGIRPALFQRARHAGGGDAREALHLNRALWNGTLGYFLEEMLGLSLARVAQVRDFFTENVTGRGPLPAIRVGVQPYGVLLTSDFPRWKWQREADGAALPGLEFVYENIRKVEQTLVERIPSVARVSAPGDPFHNLLDTLGLNPTSVEFYRRYAVGLEYLWNYQAYSLVPITERARMMQALRELSDSIAEQLGVSQARLPAIFLLSFFLRQDLVRDPLVDDIPREEAEQLSETKMLRAIYSVPDPANPLAAAAANYIGWLAASPYGSIKEQRFTDLAGERLPVPRPLLYRVLRSALLEAVYDAALRLYTRFNLVDLRARREVELGNIQLGRTVTRWEFIDAPIGQVLPDLDEGKERIAEYLLSGEGLDLPEAADLRQVLESIRALAGLSTARLERVFAEHVDLCSYRLDAWQTGCFNRRLWQQRFPPESQGKFGERVTGLYLGAFGWLEDLRLGPEPVPADPASVPAALHDPQRDGPLFVQPDNAGFIHTPSLNHAVTAAVLRSAYLTHFDRRRPEKMAVDLSSERVRAALAFLEGVNNGQALGALLGYQFERGLHDRQGNLGLDAFIPFFRRRFPLVADKLTQDESGEQAETRAARNVFDGFALIDAVFLDDPPLAYPYGISDLPPAESPRGKAIRAEVARLAESLDALADLSLAEGVYQVAQGNFERAGGMLKAMTQGDAPPMPEIVQTPRGGTALTQRVVLHLRPGPVTSPWPGAPTRRSALEPGLNAWIGLLLPRPGKIHYAVRLAGGEMTAHNLVGLGLQPIDLVYLAGDDLAGETTELESRIIFLHRAQQQDDALEVRIDFQSAPRDPQAVTLFELLPLLRALRRLVTNSRPLGAADYELPSESTTGQANPQGVLLPNLRARVQAALSAFEAAVRALRAAIPPSGPDEQPDPAQARPAALRSALRALSDFGVPDAFPKSAAGASPEAKAALASQAVLVHAAASERLARAVEHKTAADGDAAGGEQQRAELYRAAVQEIIGPAFNLVPLFNLRNRAELQAAAGFRDAFPPNNLTRHHQGNPLLVDEWLEGAARVQPALATLETIQLLGEGFGAPAAQLKPLQLPFRRADHWLGAPFPEDFSPEGEYLSILQALPPIGFRPNELQAGLLVDEWVEVLPNRSETTGIAFHFNQPNSEPPQALLLAVTPEVSGAWTWEKLVGILRDTFRRARLRGVEPAHVDDTVYAQLLPAIVTPVAGHPFATIATDLIHQTAARFPRPLDE
jgi:hypothetical protein